MGLGSPDEIPYEAKQDGVEVPGDAAIAATGVVLVAPDMGLAGDAAGLSIAMAGRGGATDEEPPDLTLEEQAARHDALAAAPKPDGAPIVALKVLQLPAAAAGDDEAEAAPAPAERPVDGALDE